jgi:hypothetical protein
MLKKIYNIVVMHKIYLINFVARALILNTTVILIKAGCKNRYIINLAYS